MRGPQGTRQTSGRNLGIRPAQYTTLSSTMENEVAHQPRRRPDLDDPDASEYEQISNEAANKIWGDGRDVASAILSAPLGYIHVIDHKRSVSDAGYFESGLKKTGILKIVL